ncbi:MAG: anthranilate phosphoribosyltransferase [Pseudomonadota bacterium]
MAETFETLKQQVLAGEALTPEEATTAFTALLSGQLDAVDITAFLVALKVRGETTEEILGAVRVLRQSCDPSLAPPGAIDTCGTGGDGLHTLNISTTAALVLAAGGVPVAKHGNRSVSSRSGSTDVLGALGVKTEQSKTQLKQALQRFNIAYMNAPAFHPTMATVAPIRRQLAARTIFNLLGPMANPAGVKRQLIGTYDLKWCAPMANVLRALGSTKAWVVHGADGQDEMSICGPTHVVELDGGAISTFTVSPSDAGLAEHGIGDIAGGDSAFNAAAMRRVLSGDEGAYRDAVMLNAGAGFYVAGVVDDLLGGAQKAGEILSSGLGLVILDDWANFTQITDLEAKDEKSS